MPPDIVPPNRDTLDIRTNGPLRSYEPAVGMVEFVRNHVLDPDLREAMLTIPGWIVESNPAYSPFDNMSAQFTLISPNRNRYPLTADYSGRLVCTLGLRDADRPDTEVWRMRLTDAMSSLNRILAAAHFKRINLDVNLMDRISSAMVSEDISEINAVTDEIDRRISRAIPRHSKPKPETEPKPKRKIHLDLEE